MENTPTVGQITELALRYDKARSARNLAQEALSQIEAEAVAMVEKYGHCPAKAEKSRRLSGLGCDITVTHADAVSVVTERVLDLKKALEANKKDSAFDGLFRERISYEAVQNPQETIANLPKRLSVRIGKMFAGCFKISPKKPALKVTVTDQAKVIGEGQGFKEYVAQIAA